MLFSHPIQNLALNPVKIVYNFPRRARSSAGDGYSPSSRSRQFQCQSSSKVLGGGGGALSPVEEIPKRCKSTDGKWGRHHRRGGDFDFKTPLRPSWGKNSSTLVSSR